MKSTSDIASEIADSMELNELDQNLDAWRELEAFCGLRADALKEAQKP